jgi:hypothetical protein
MQNYIITILQPAKRNIFSINLSNGQEKVFAGRAILKLNYDKL